jgi:hypothetical protein
MFLIVEVFVKTGGLNLQGDTKERNEEYLEKELI